MVFLNFIKNSIKAYFFNYDALDYIDEKVDWKTAFFSVWGLTAFITILNFINFNSFNKRRDE